MKHLIVNTAFCDCESLVILIWSGLRWCTMCDCNVCGLGLWNVDACMRTHSLHRSWSSDRSCSRCVPRHQRRGKHHHRRRNGCSSRTRAGGVPSGIGAWVMLGARRRYPHVCGSSWWGSSQGPCSQGTLSCGRFEGSANEKKIIPTFRTHDHLSHFRFQQLYVRSNCDMNGFWRKFQRLCSHAGAAKLCRLKRRDQCERYQHVNVE